MRADFLPWICMIGLFIACNGDKVVYNQMHELPSGAWSEGQDLEFYIIVEDLEKPYRLLLFLEYATDYDWQNLYTRVTTTKPDGEAQKNVVSFELADQIGNWLGDCSRSKCQLTIPLQDPVRFDQKGQYKFRFEQWMRKTNVNGIERLGLRLVEIHEAND